MVTLEQIKKLRDDTGVSTMACKKALEEANGDQEKAIEILRKKGEAKAASRSERSTAQGVVAVSEGQGKVAMITLACETDFVAKNEDFINEAKKLADKVLSEGEEADLSGVIGDLTIKLGEKIELKNKEIFEGKNIGTYIHSNNKIGTAVVLSGGETEVARDIAMHIAAMNPGYISPDEVPVALVEKEKEIWTAQLKQEGKPENIWANIMQGKERKFREENALLKQAFVKNPEETIEKLLGDLKIETFTRMSV
ncbi:translation elongation factor Ts [Candidatus Peregrinibacteria bacterium CG22_combo_CG10-13_8_21_14_all_44_10]|nr:MAG: translation elongation factor Ts [Candidatus Peregrinibacteria bacterium CG22_combo_CG10-13_8_21_14_all_44_10]PIS04081.1 MAG: translation elongation factor Ts [Candidatus Peregrinibacteria bacterium CG10_big_fil_rev_8_21_14_0_10_44_7]PIX79747.1 MAG: translation elongation factor Ts [Candidatus Peregrinibacteria bacterium CG_4_10_14_3_um_filter_44_21]PJB89633.1 MAG: translation elongation factor Ts [Candidatus Peregrinibacteria bacterium CG_4_9_14_0_8_um_filter_44_15]